MRRMRLLAVIFPLLMLCAGVAQMQSTNGNAVAFAHPLLQNVNVLHGPDGVSVEISASGPLFPTATLVLNPDRLVIDLPNTVAGRLRTIAVQADGVKAVRFAQNSVRPPVARVVVDLQQAQEYELVREGNKVLVRLHSASSAAVPATSPPASPISATTKPQPVVAIGKPQATAVPASYSTWAAAASSAAASAPEDFVFAEPTYAAKPAPAVPPERALKAAATMAATRPESLVLPPESASMQASAIAVAQSTAGFYISGVIASSDCKIPGAVITAKSTATGKTFSTVSDDQGRYTLAVPAPGIYHLGFELFGFVPADRLVLINGREAHADFTVVLSTIQNSTATQHLETPQGSGGMEEAALARPHRRDTKDSLPLSADMPLEFSFVGGEVAQPVTVADSVDVHAPTRQLAVHGTVYYQAGNSALDASPYALHGIAAEKPKYAQNNFGANLGGPLPWVKKGTTSVFVNYSGNRSGNPYNGFANLPSPTLRAGDFSGLRVPYGPAAGQPIALYDPETGQAFPANRIPPERMSPAAVALLRYMPLPNWDGMSQNFRFVSATRTRSDGFGLMLTRVPSGLTDSGKNAPARNNFSAGLGYRRSATNLPTRFPLLGGDSTSNSWNANLAHTLTKSFFTNNLRLGFDSTKWRISNHFRNDIAAALGINGVSRDSFDWGLPSIAFTQFTGLQDIAPAFRADRNFRVADALSWSHGQHNLKWGGEFSRLTFDLHPSNDARGSFIFTGFATAQLAGGTPVPGTGSDFADFLLGLPQKTHVQYSNDTYSFAGDAWSLYFVDDWRLAKNLTLNMGLRSEYVSPLSEAQNRLVTLDAPSNFSAVAVVSAGGTGPFSGPYPDTIVAPDRNNFAPRIGVAWRAAERLIVKAGYSVNYDPSLYNSLATRLATQPPFAVGHTGITTGSQALTLENGFSLLQPDSVGNDFAVPRNLPLGYAQVWLLQVQRELPGGIALVTSYAGTKGSRLEMLRAPNRTATGLLLPDVAPFLWDTAEGSSILHAGSLRVEKRLDHGLSVDASYMFSRSIDDVPALADDTPVAQDELNLKAERSLSAFDQRHRLTVDYAYELPFGRGMGTSSVGNRVFGVWSLTGTIRYGSGYPLTPHVLGDFTDVNRGGYGALRPDVTGRPVELPQPTVERFFNTSAFKLPPPESYGNAGRNSIIGPAIFTMDAAVQKSFQLREGHTLQFRAQASNLLNTPEFTQIDTNLRSLSYGQITGVGSMRVIQLMLRYGF